MSVDIAHTAKKNMHIFDYELKHFYSPKAFYLFLRKAVNAHIQSESRCFIQIHNY